MREELLLLAEVVQRVVGFLRSWSRHMQDLNLRSSADAEHPPSSLRPTIIILNLEKVLLAYAQHLKSFSAPNNSFYLTPSRALS